MALSSKQHKILPLQMEKNGLRQAEKLKNQKSSLRAAKAKRQVVTYGGVSWPRPLVQQLMKNGYVKNLIFDPRSRFNGCYAHPTYSLGKGLDLHGKLQPDAL